MTAYVLRRLAWIVVLLLLVSAVTFAVFYLLPSGDPALQRAGKNPTPQLVENIRHQLGLDRSAPEQYWLYVRDLALHFDFGTSYRFNTPVREVLFDRLPATIYLAVGAVVFWMLIGIPIGILSALRPRSRFDRLAMGGALLAISAPVYWLGLVALYLFASDIGVLKIFPGAGSYVPPSEDFGAFLGSMILPWLVLAASFAAIYARVMRASLIEVMSEDYIRTARAKGVAERDVVLRHGVRSAATPIVTLLGLDLGILLGGALLVEYVFNIPGVGRLAFDSIESQDLPVIQGTVLLGAVSIVVMTLVVDIAYAFLDPRIRYA